MRGVNVTIENTYYGAMTDPTGRFSLKTSLEPPFELKISREGYTSQTVKITAGGDQTLTLQLLQHGAKNRAEGLSAPEYQLKLAFIEKFIELTTWPAPAASQPFVIGIYGQNPFGDDLFALEQKQFKGRKVQIQFLPDLEEIGGQDALFVPQAPPATATDISNVLKTKPILSICDVGLCADGGMMIGFVLAEEKIRFCLNKPALAAAHLQVDPLLESMALK